MFLKWYLKSWLHLWLALIATNISPSSTSTTSTFQNNSINDNNYSRVIPSKYYDSLSNTNSENGYANIRNRRAAVVQTPLRLIDEKQCPEIRNLCTNLRDSADDLPVLECIQTFLSNQIESLSDECQHAIWTHTGTYHT